MHAATSNYRYLYVHVCLVYVLYHAYTYFIPYSYTRMVQFCNKHTRTVWYDPAYAAYNLTIYVLRLRKDSTAIRNRPTALLLLLYMQFFIFYSSILLGCSSLSCKLVGIDHVYMKSYIGLRKTSHSIKQLCCSIVCKKR